MKRRDIPGERILLIDVPMFDLEASIIAGTVERRLLSGSGVLVEVDQMVHLPPALRLFCFLNTGLE